MALKQKTHDMKKREAKMSEKEEVERSDAFRMFYHKIQPCSKRYAHDWTACPYSHDNERARRRCPRSHHYAAVMCPEMHKAGSCPRGDSCSMAHNVFEYWLHPQRYHTQLCKDGASCERRVCFFAHCLEELRAPGSAASSNLATAADSAGPADEGFAALLPSTRQQCVPGGGSRAATAVNGSTFISSNSPETGSYALSFLQQWHGLTNTGQQLQAMGAPAADTGISCAGNLYSPNSCPGTLSNPSSYAGTLNNPISCAGTLISPSSCTHLQLQPPAAPISGLNSMLPASHSERLSPASTDSSTTLPQYLMPAGSHPGMQNLLLQQGPGFPSVAEPQVMAQPGEAEAIDAGLSFQLQQLNVGSTTVDELLTILSRQLEHNMQEAAAVRARVAASSSQPQACSSLSTASSSVGQVQPAAVIVLPAGWK